MKTTDPLIFGADDTPGIVACEHIEKAGQPDHVVCFIRDDAGLRTVQEPFQPYCWIDDPGRLADCDTPFSVSEWTGEAPLKYEVRCTSSKELQSVVQYLKKATRAAPASTDAPYFVCTDKVQQYLMQSGRTLFKGMAFSDIVRMQVDIETYCAPGYDFSNPERTEDRIIAIALADQTGWTQVLSGVEWDEKSLLQRFVTCVQDRDPDVIEGHNCFKFDWPYIVARAKRHRVPLALGRDGSRLRVSSGRFTAGERAIAYPKTEIMGRHVIDTFFMVQSYDVTHRSLEGYGLKEVARHFGVAADERTYIAGPDIARTFDEEPERLMEYALHDILETRALSTLLAPVYFAQTQMIPYGYQNVVVRGNGTKIDSLLLRAYVRQRQSLPIPGERKAFEGGYTDIFFTGVAHNVHHCDVRSLYPSLMLTQSIGSRADSLNVFLKLLDYLRSFRIDAKQRMQTLSGEERTYWEALQTAYKVLINSFYGYLGFSQARFNDFDAAARVAEQGRDLLHRMIEQIRALGGHPIEIDTDGIYFVPPPFESEQEQESFRAHVRSVLPSGIEIEFDGEYAAMFSYKMKNYALLDQDGRVSLKGAALKSRGLEPFQRAFLREMIEYILTDRQASIGALKERYQQAIMEAEWPIEQFAKTETLQESPARYQEKISGKSRGRNAAYELALRADRTYQAGDQIAYYVSGARKNVAVHEAARLVTDWDPDDRDENRAYYLAKLDNLASKFDEALAGEGDDAVSSQQELWE